MNADESGKAELPLVDGRALGAPILIVWCLLALIMVLLCAVLFGR